MLFLVEILAHTPIWVWFVLAALLVLGLGRIRSSTRSRASLIAPALIFALIAVVKLALARFDGVTLLGTLAGGLVGLGFVAATRPARLTRRLPSGKYVIKGEWMTLTITLAVFLGNYTNAVLLILQPKFAATPGVAATIAAINGFSAFFMAGRTIAHLRADRTPAIPAPKMIEAQ